MDEGQKNGGYHVGSMEGKMPSGVKRNIKVEPETSQLSEREARVLLILCAELVNLCANVTRQIDPSAAAMLAYVRDDIRFEGKFLLP